MWFDGDDDDDVVVEESIPGEYDLGDELGEMIGEHDAGDSAI